MLGRVKRLGRNAPSGASARNAGADEAVSHNQLKNKMNIYTVSLEKQLPSKAIMAADLLRFQLRTGFPIQKALELYKRPLSWTFTNKREARRHAAACRKDGTGRAVTLTVKSR